MSGPAMNRVVANFSAAATGDKTIQLKDLRGRKFMGVVRSTFLLGADGKLRGEWRNVKVKGHVDAIYDAVRALDQ